MVEPDEFARRLSVIHARIAGAGADPSTVTVVAVTKGFGPEAVALAARGGCTAVGESYAQELAAKLPLVAADPTVPAVEVHFIGRLQSNKVGLLAPHVHVWQSVDRASLVDAIARRAPGANVLVQVNVGDEPQKGGCAPADVHLLVASARDAGLSVAGLMAVGRTGPPDEARPGFALLSRLADAEGLAVRSMGMTDDLEVAVQEGSTMVRVGSALFGSRPTR